MITSESTYWKQKEVKPNQQFSDADYKTEHDLLVSYVEVKFRKLRRPGEPVKFGLEDIIKM